MAEVGMIWVMDRFNDALSSEYAIPSVYFRMGLSDAEIDALGFNPHGCFWRRNMFGMEYDDWHLPSGAWYAEDMASHSMEARRHRMIVHPNVAKHARARRILTLIQLEKKVSEAGVRFMIAEFYAKGMRIVAKRPLAITAAVPSSPATSVFASMGL